jgi:hypothetical protein
MGENARSLEDLPLYEGSSISVNVAHKVLGQSFAVWRNPTSRYHCSYTVKGILVYTVMTPRDLHIVAAGDLEQPHDSRSVKLRLVLKNSLHHSICTQTITDGITPT